VSMPPLLVRHPAPYPTESLLGYVLRLSEKNGYVSPSSVCRLAGIKQSELGAIGLKVERLAAIASCGAADLNQIAFALLVKHRRCSQLLGHRLVPRELNLAQPKLCPQCVVEKGFIEAHWHLELMVACPIHQCIATSQCPKCRKPLRWFRPGLLECECGGNLLDSKMPPISRAEAGLLELMRRKVLGDPAGKENPASLPQEQLMTMDLRSMLTLIRALARHRSVADNCTADPDMKQIILTASSVLTDWPKNFIALLKDIGQRAPATTYGGVGKQFEGIYRDLFRNIAIRPSEHTDFLRIAFLEFAMDRGESGPVHGNSTDELPGAEPQRFLTQAEFEEQIRMQQKTAARLLKGSKLSSERVKSDRANSTIVDAKQNASPRIAPCDRGMVPDIVRLGLLHRRVVLVDLRLADGAGSEFRREFISLATVAETKHTSSRELLRRCGEHGLSMLLMPTKRQGLQPFIRAANQGRLSGRVVDMSRRALRS